MGIYFTLEIMHHAHYGCFVIVGIDPHGDGRLNPHTEGMDCNAIIMYPRDEYSWG